MNTLSLGVIFLAEILVLFWLSRQLFQLIGRKIEHLARSRRITMYALALIFLPGTIIHEFAHLIVARALFVPTGQMVLWPRMEEEGFRLGSVAIANTDSLRRLLIGAAPFLVGVSLISAILWFVTNQNVGAWWHWAIAGIAIFQIGNTMFSSKKDLEGTGVAILLFVVLAIVMYFIGVRIPAAAAMQLAKTLSTANIFLLVPIGIDLVLVLISKLS